VSASSDSAHDATGLARLGMIHGRFQPFHNGHLEYLHLARERCQTLIIGITNPDPLQTAEEETSEHRHLDGANPFTFIERQMMIREVLFDEGVSLDRIIFIPFPVNLPDRWRYYVPAGAVQYIRVFSPWEQAKVDRLRAFGYRVEILQPGVEKLVEASEVRRRLAAGEDWQELVPPGVARTIRAHTVRALTSERADEGVG
jgi:cytidyltransferase-like protein